MILKSLKLQNIRSYIDQTLELSKSSTLLSGDIGSGKSTILLAIEFALFGTSRPDLPAESLLRKGSTEGSVELVFEIENKPITIKRSLKKSKDSIKQTAGHLIVNSTKKDLMPIELKAEIISLLGYPEESLNKNKNYVFRYTVYTPQEEMKLILQEHPEIRLDTLRKIFNVDKYKKIRENIYYYLKEIKIKSTILDTKTENFEQKQKQHQEVIVQKEELETQNTSLLSQIKELKEKIINKKSQIEEFEEKNKNSLKLKNELENARSLIKEKKEQSQLSQQKQQQLSKDIQQFPSFPSLEELNQQLALLEQQQRSNITKKTTLETKIQNCQDQVSDIQQEIINFDQTKKLYEEKKQEQFLLEKELQNKSSFLEKKETIQENLNELSQLYHKTFALNQQAKETKENISRLDQCPTCLQEVSQDHKDNISQKEEDRISRTDNMLSDLDQKKTNLQEKFLENNHNLELLTKKETSLGRTKTELAILKEKSSSLDEKKEKLQELVKQNNSLIKGLEELNKSNPEKITQEIENKKNSIHQLIRKNNLENNLLETNSTLNKLLQQLSHLEQQQTNLTELIKNNPDLTELIKEQKFLFDGINNKEKNLSLEQATVQTKVNHLQQQISLVEEDLSKLKQLKSSLLRLKDLRHWLSEFFLNLTYTIEKQVMTKIHQTFDSLFQEWFSILIEDENIYSRLDDSFTPIIEHNGYEVAFNSLSGGERTSASLAYRLALNKVINEIIHNIKTKDLIILDEPTDGFSSEQLDKVRDVLEKLNLQQTLLVSHEPKIESFVENIIRITKEEGVSRIF